MTDDTSSVKDFLRSKIAEMSQQLSKITDAEDAAATHTLVGKCYLEMTNPIDKKVEPKPWRYVKFVGANHGKLTVMTIKTQSSDVLEISERDYRSALTLVDHFEAITEDKFAYALRERLSAILKQATGQTYRFEVTE
jgi:hypothetical protein